MPAHSAETRFCRTTPLTTITSGHSKPVAVMNWETVCSSIGGSIMPTTSDMDTKRLRLEPYEGKFSRTVLRGLGYSDVARLPGGEAQLHPSVKKS